MNIATINREWNFITKEITAFNRSGTEKGIILFELQILLSTLSKTKNPKEKQILTSIYQKQKDKYLVL